MRASHDIDVSDIPAFLLKKLEDGLKERFENLSSLTPADEMIWSKLAKTCNVIFEEETRQHSELYNKYLLATMDACRGTQ